jgi:hypothetical protein
MDGWQVIINGNHVATVDLPAWKDGNIRAASDYREMIAEAAQPTWLDPPVYVELRLAAWAEGTL